MHDLLANELEVSGSRDGLEGLGVKFADLPRSSWRITFGLNPGKRTADCEHDVPGEFMPIGTLGRIDDRYEAIG